MLNLSNSRAGKAFIRAEDVDAVSIQLQNSSLTRLDRLSCFANLRELNLDNCGLTNKLIRPLAQLPALRVLLLRANQLTSLDGLDALEVLDISLNPIRPEFCLKEQMHMRRLVFGLNESGHARQYLRNSRMFKQDGPGLLADFVANDHEYVITQRGGTKSLRATGLLVLPHFEVAVAFTKRFQTRVL